MVNEVARHSGDRLNQSTLIVGGFQTHPEERLAFRIHSAGFLHPVVKSGNLFDAIR